MKKLLFAVLFGSFFSTAYAQSTKPIFIQDSLKLISSQFKFTEGASVDKQGNVFFTDQPNNTIWKYDINGKLSLFMEPAGRANGTYFDQKGNLIVCADEHNEIWSIDRNKKVRVLFSDFEGKKVNGPNDLWIDAKGGVYFTDPYYQRDYWTRQASELDGEKVYYLPKGKKTAKIVATGMQRPNGIVGTPNGKYLYVADRKADVTYRYTINEDASLINQTLLFKQGSDGMTLDAAGNIYITGKGVDIYQPDGAKIGHIDVPEDWCGNICFGGVNRDTLFITASKSVYRMKTTTKGVE